MSSIATHPGLRFKSCQAMPDGAVFTGAGGGWYRYWVKQYGGSRSAHGFVFAVYRPEHNRHKLRRLKLKHQDTMIGRVYVAENTSSAKVT